MYAHMYGSAPKPHDEALMWGLAALSESMDSVDYRATVGALDGIHHLDDFYTGVRYGLMLASQMTKAMEGKDNLTYQDFIMTIASLAGFGDIPDDISDLIHDDTR